MLLLLLTLAQDPADIAPGCRNRPRAAAAAVEEAPAPPSSPVDDGVPELVTLTVAGVAAGALAVNVVSFAVIAAQQKSDGFSKDEVERENLLTVVNLASAGVGIAAGLTAVALVPFTDWE